MWQRIRGYWQYRRQRRQAWRKRQWCLVCEASSLEYRLHDLSQQIMFTGGSTKVYFHWKRVERIRQRAHQRYWRRLRKYNYSGGHVRNEKTYK